ncbi:MAG: B12-binding domain-containing protein [Candidatus Bathyarchaeia archaeon]
MSGRAEYLEEVAVAIESLDEEKIRDAVRRCLDKGIDASDIIEKGIGKGLRIVGEKFERGEYFITELVGAAEPTQRVVKELLEPEVRKAKKAKGMGKIVLGTVEGDIHSIGKNIVAAMFFAAGFDVIDLGEDVPAEKFAKTAKEVNADLVGASALLTTTLPGQKKVIEALRAEGIRDKVKVIFGGAPCTPEWVREIGGDGYAENAMQGVIVAKKLLKIKDQ